MLTSYVLGIQFQALLVTAKFTSLWEALFLGLLEGRSYQVSRRQTKDASVNSRLQRMPRMQCSQRAPSPLSALPTRGGRGGILFTLRALPGLVETLAQAYQMPTSLREQGKLLKARDRFGQARFLYSWGGRQGPGFPQVSPSGKTHSKWAIISCYMYALPQDRQKGLKNRKL